MLKHFFAIFCLKYLVLTISVISVTGLWSVIRIYKKKKEYWNTAAIFQYMPGKMIITRCSDLIQHKIGVQYKNIWILSKVTFIQRHLCHARELV